MFFKSSSSFRNVHLFEVIFRKENYITKNYMDEREETVKCPQDPSIIANQGCSAAARWSSSVHLLLMILFAECLLLS